MPTPYYDTLAEADYDALTEAQYDGLGQAVYVPKINPKWVNWQDAPPGYVLPTVTVQVAGS